MNHVARHDGGFGSLHFCMDNDCVNDISNATDGPQRKKRHLSEQHFLPAYTARVARGREIETRPISRVGPTSRPTARYANDNVTFRFAMGAASIYILKQPSTYRTRSQLNPRSPLVNSSTRVISSILKYWQPRVQSYIMPELRTSPPRLVSRPGNESLHNYINLWYWRSLEYYMVFGPYLY